MTVIIFEGPDGVGKTEIARALEKEIRISSLFPDEPWKTPIPYFRMGSQHENWRKGRFKDALEFDQTYISEFLAQTKFSVIIDRAYPSEFVYSHVYGRETNMEVLRSVDEKFASIGTVIILLLRRDYSNSRPDEVVENSKLQALHDRYNEFADNFTKCKVIRMYVDDYDNELSKQIPFLMHKLQTLEAYR